MREVLIRYLMGELDADERRELLAQLKSSPELQQELARLRACFAEHQYDDSELSGPPRGLAARTAERIIGGDDETDSADAGQAAAFTTAGDPPAGLLGWSLADLTVAGGVMLAVSMLIFPALRNSRDDTRRQFCENNLHNLLVLSTTYSDDHADLFPEIGEKEHAGGFVAQLIGKGYVHHKDIAVWLICPSSPYANKLRSIELPSQAQLGAMTKDQVAQFAATAAPCYAYSLPHRIGHEYYYVKNDRQPTTPVFSDAWGEDENGPMTLNHKGRIVQVQFADGSHKSLTMCKLPGLDDDLFHNDRGLVAAGMRRHDTVMGNSSAIPGIEPAGLGR